MKKLFTFLFILSLIPLAAQVPLDSLTVWLSASERVFTDAAFCNTPSVNEGDDVFCWQDRTENEFRFRRIENGTPRLKLNSPDTLNGRSSVFFDGTFGLGTAPSDVFAVTEMTIFLVGSNTGTGITISREGTWNNSFRLNAEYAMHHSGSGAWTRRGHQVDWSGFSHLISTGTFGADENDLDLRINGLQSSLNLVEDIIAVDYSPVTRAAYIAQRGNNTSVRTGDIAEIIVYRQRKLGDVQRIIVENHLSSKYDIAIVPESDFYDFDTEAAGDFDCNVAGIGHDGTDSLDFNNSSELILRPATTGISGDGYYLFAGHRDLPNGITSQDLPAGISERFSRAWAVEKTGSVPVTLEFSFTDLTGLEGSPDLEGEYFLLYSPTADPYDFSIVEDISIQVTSTSVIASLPDNALSNGYYTLGAGDQLLDDPISSVDTRNDIATLKAYPNPAIQQLTLEGPVEAGNYRIFDALGREMQSGKIGPGHSIDIRRLPAGNFQLLIQAPGGKAYRATFLKY